MIRIHKIPLTSNIFLNTRNYEFVVTNFCAMYDCLIQLHETAMISGFKINNFAVVLLKNSLFFIVYGIM